jgi:hypothetical protein
MLPMIFVFHKLDCNNYNYYLKANNTTAILSGGWDSKLGKGLWVILILTLKQAWYLVCSKTQNWWKVKKNDFKLIY